MGKKLTTVSFIEKAITKHGKKYDYKKVIYSTSSSKVIITCREHGDFEQRANSHLRGSNCPFCIGTKKLTLEEFIEKAKIKHNNKYNYGKSEYKNHRTVVSISCNLHGNFEQRPNHHLQGHGCPKCGNLDRGCSKTDFNKHCIKNNNGLGILYVIRCFNETESFYKVGRTSKNIVTRFKYELPYNYEVVSEVHKEPSKIYDMENQLLRELADDKYQPLIPFSGQTECFSNLETLYTVLLQNLDKLLITK